MKNIKLKLHNDIMIFQDLIKDTELIINAWSSEHKSLLEIFKEIDKLDKSIEPNCNINRHRITEEFESKIKYVEKVIGSKLNLLLEVDERVEYSLKFVRKFTTDLLNELQSIEAEKDTLSKSIHQFIQKSNLIRQIKKYEKLLIQSTNSYIKLDNFNDNIKENYKSILFYYENLQFIDSSYNNARQITNQTNNNNSNEVEMETESKSLMMKPASFKMSDSLNKKESFSNHKNPITSQDKLEFINDDLSEKEKEFGLEDNTPSWKKHREIKVIIRKYFEPDKDGDSDEFDDTIERELELNPVLFNRPVHEQENDDIAQDSNFHVPIDALDNIKLWPTYLYRLYSVRTKRQQIACILRALPGCIHSKNRINVSFVDPSRPLPPIDLHEKIVSQIIEIEPNINESGPNFVFNPGWRIIMPIILSRNSNKDFIMLKLVKVDGKLSMLSIIEEKSNNNFSMSNIPLDLAQIGQRKSKRNSVDSTLGTRTTGSRVFTHTWMEIPCVDVQIERQRERKLRMVEGKLELDECPFGVYLVMTKTRVEKGTVNKQGARFISSLDNHVFISIPPGAIRINMEVTWKIIMVDSVFWNELKRKHEKILEKIIHCSHFVQFDCHKKKLLKPATVNLQLLRSIEPDENNVLMIHEKSDSESMLSNNKIRIGLDPFQTIMLSNRVIKMSSNEKVTMMCYSDDEKWLEMENCQITSDKAGEQLSVELRTIQPFKFFLVRSKRNATSEELSRATNLVYKEFSVRNCLIALFKSTSALTHYQLVICLKSQFDKICTYFQDNYFALEPFNAPVAIELNERQCLSMVLTGNIKNQEASIPDIQHHSFQSAYKNQIDFHLKEIDQNAQRLLDHYRGYLEIYTKKTVKKVTDNEVMTRKMMYWTEEDVKVCSFLLKIPRKLTKKMKPYRNTMLNEKLAENGLILISFVIQRLGSHWRELGLALQIPRARIDIISQQFAEYDNYRIAAQLLMFWIKGKLLMENKLTQLQKALEEIGRNDIASELGELFVEEEGYDIS